MRARRVSFVCRTDARRVREGREGAAVPGQIVSTAVPVRECSGTGGTVPRTQELLLQVRPAGKVLDADFERRHCLGTRFESDCELCIENFRMFFMGCRPL